MNNSYDALLDPAQAINTYDLVKYTLSNVPRQVRLETSSFCTMGCRFCHLWGDFFTRTREPGRMTPELFDLILDDIATWPEMPKEIVPVNFGELLLSKHWEWMLHRLSERLPKVSVHLVTTGLRLNPDTIEKLAQARTLKYVNFSLNAFFPATWERVHKVPAKFMPRVVEAVHTFRDRRPDVEVNVSMVHSPELQTELEKDLFKAYWGKYVSEKFTFSVSQTSYVNNPKHMPVEPVTLSCRSMFDGLVILETGKVLTGCCFDGQGELAIGQFPEEKLLDIWRGDRLKNLTELHNSGRRNEIKYCSGCTYA